MIRIIPYKTKYQPDFKRLNLAWLDQYGLTESHDLKVLNDPDGTIIDHGGCLFLAMDEDKVIGNAGLEKETGTTYELVKMTVDPAYRGRGISKILLDTCISKARELGATRLILYSNSQLTTALRLYEQYGFRHIPATGAPFLTADVKMELSLSPNP